MPIGIQTTAARAACSTPTAQQKFENIIANISDIAPTNADHITAIFKAACAAYQEATYSPRSFSFFGRSFGSNHQTQVARWASAANITAEEVGAYIENQTINPSGDFAKTVRRAFAKVSPTPAASTVAVEMTSH
jgi:hypothetical protein